MDWRNECLAFQTAETAMFLKRQHFLRMASEVVDLARRLGLGGHACGGFKLHLHLARGETLILITLEGMQVDITDRN